MIIRKVLFKDIPNDCVFRAFWDPNKQIWLDSFRCYKDEHGNVLSKEFSNLKLKPNEPCLVSDEELALTEKRKANNVTLTY